MHWTSFICRVVGGDFSLYTFVHFASLCNACFIKSCFSCSTHSAAIKKRLCTAPLPPKHQHTQCGVFIVLSHFFFCEGSTIASSTEENKGFTATVPDELWLLFPSFLCSFAIVALSRNTKPNMTAREGEQER